MTRGSMKKLSIVCPIDNGKIHQSSGRRVGEYIKECANQNLPCVEITVAPYKPTRSDKQNRYYWGVVVDYVRTLFESGGESYDDEEVHEILMHEVGKYKRAVAMKNGNIHIIRLSSAKLNTQEFEIYLEKVRAWAAAEGCIIPLPNEA